MNAEFWVIKSNWTFYKNFKIECPVTARVFIMKTLEERL